MSSATAPAAHLSPAEKRALLAELLRKKANAPKAFPLSFGQQRLWFLDQFAPGTPVYNLATTARLSGAHDLRALQRSLATIIARHAALRTTFALAGEQPVQLVAPRLSWRDGTGTRPLFALLDLRRLPAALREAELWRIAAAETQQPFDLARGPLLRARVVRLADDEHMLLLTLHHIIADGWSLGVFVRELTALYAGYAVGAPVALPPLPIQYVDFAVWQRGWLQGEVLETQLRYWRAQLGGADGHAGPPLLALPTDRPRPPVQTFRGANLRKRLPGPLSDALARLCQEMDITLFMLALAAFQALLARYSGQDDILVGTPIANRTQAETEGLIGFFVNTLVLRTDLSGRPSFRALLERVREVCLSAYAHQDLPFEMLVEALAPERDLSRSPLFQVMLIMRNTPQPLISLPRLTMQVVGGPTATAMFDLALSLSEMPAGLDGSWEYATDLFDATTIMRMQTHFQALLAGIVAEPDRRLADLPLLSRAERAQLLFEWNDSLREVRSQKSEVRRLPDSWLLTPDSWPLTSDSTCIHRLFEAQAERTPDAVACVTMNDEERTMKLADRPFIVHRSSFIVQITYGELNARANQLAHYLRARGAGPEVRIAIALERSPELLIALLGVLKSGAAYVPLDPSYPSERIGFMLEDSSAAVLLTNSEQRTTNDEGRMTNDEREPSSFVIRPSSLIEVVDLRADGPAIARQPAHNPAASACGENLAYVIYTSGSTGTPKGVAISHAALGSFVRALPAAIRPGPHDALLALTTIAFDIAALELFLPLAHGARVVLLPTAVAADGPALTAAIAAHAPSFIQATPATWRLLLAAGWPGATRLTALCGGEALPADLASQLLPRTAALWNLYGPTEATIWASALRVGDIQTPMPIGRPIANTQLYVLDAALQPALVGVVGELYIGGIGLARGYLNRPDLTADRFVPNPFSTNDQRRRTNDEGSDSSFVLRPSSGARLYRTGDLARYLPDGTLAFLGRGDQQIKLRSHRIELGEIEAMLSRHPAVREVAVVVCGDGDDDARLAAYVVRDAAYTADAAGRATWQTEQLAQWRAAWTATYDQPPTHTDPTFNLRGWISSASGEPLPDDAMRAWIDATVARIERLAPRQVLEIGCGTGLLLSRLAPRCIRYIGTDLAPAALGFLRRQVLTPPQSWSHVTLLERPAHELADLAPGSFDTVILNSVVQYFPSAEYLLTVLSAAARLVAPGGRIFVGDVRSLPLLEAQHAELELGRALATLPTVALRMRVRTAVLREEELALDPAFFAALPRVLPALKGVTIQLKRGPQVNELTRYRYDVTLQIGMAQAAPPEISRAWEPKLTPSALRQLLRSSAPAALRIRGVPNARVAPMVRLAALLKRADAPPTVGELQAALAETETALDPDDWIVDADLSYDVLCTWSEDGVDRYDVLLRRTTPGAAPAPSDEPRATNGASARDGWWREYANDPLAERQQQQLAAELRAWLARYLPGYMAPGMIELIAALPRTPNGKIDRRALPDPAGRAQSRATYTAPRTPVEQTIAAIWQEVLRIERIGIHDNFFALGGHSLLATQMIARLQHALEQTLSVRLLFEAPTIAELAARLVPAPDEAAPHAADAIQPAPALAVHPLSFGQQRLWFLDQLAPGMPVYTIAAGVRLNGPLHLTALYRSLAAIVARHGALRTTFAIANGAPCQIVAPTLALRLPLADLSALPSARREPTFERLSQAVQRIPFDLTRGPLLRIFLVRLDSQEHVLILMMHHIIADGWSFGVFVRELVAHYPAYRSGAPIRLPDLPMQYVDYAAWQRTWLQGELMQRQLDYWRAQLGDAGIYGAPPVLDLPTDFPRPRAQHFRGAQQGLKLSQPLTAALKQLSYQANTTLFMTLLAAFDVLLARYSGQNDLAVGTPIAGRTKGETEGLIGFFLNTLVLRARLSDAISFDELLQQARETCLGAYSHQDLPFEYLVEALAPQRDLSRQPLFQVLFVLQDESVLALRLPDLALRAISLDRGAAQFDLTFSLIDTQIGLLGAAEYNTDLFEAPTITRMIRHFERLLHGLVVQPDQPVAALPLLSAAERQQVLVEWNDTTSGVRSRGSEVRSRGEACLAPTWLLNTDDCLHHLFEQQAARAPDAIALVFEATTARDKGRRTKDESSDSSFVLRPSSDTQHLTYAELNRRANKLAHHLRALGVGPEVPVAIWLERSFELLMGMLGVLKAGGAYLPLDPTYPAERLAFMIGDSRARVLVTNDEGRRTNNQIRHLVTLSPCHLVNLEAEWSAIAQMPDYAPASPTTADSLAYAIYTSGSTGAPKGAMISHRSLVNRLVWMQRTYQLGPGDRVLHKTPISFDVSVWELGWPLLAGAPLVLAAPGLHTDPAALARLIARQQISVLHFVPSLLELFLDTPRRPPARHLRQLICSGEALAPDLLARCCAQLDATLDNLYGPTEAAIDVTAWRARRGHTPWRVPIGRPIDNTQIYVLDRSQQPTPIGVPGELHIGGAQLARGYLGRPDLTAAAFVPNPFGTTNDERRTTNEESELSSFVVRHSSGARLYKTGDRARYRTDGQIEYLGRLDGQIKLRGVRIEPGEIEAALREHPSVAECAVRASTEADGAPRLVAYVVLTNDEGRTTNDELQSSSFFLRPSSFDSELRSFLAERLPAALVPALFVPLDALPLTPSGKLDRRALPLPSDLPTSDGAGFVAPRTPLEEQIAAIWRDVLGRAEIGVHDNFFALGGHSLLATQISVRLRDALGQEAPVRLLFEAPTIAELAAHFAHAPGAAPGADQAIQPLGRDSAPLSFAQQRLWFLDQLAPGNPAYNLALAVELDGPLDRRALRHALTALVARHEALRTTVAQRDGQPAQVIAPARPVALHMSDLRALPAAMHAPASLQQARQFVLRPFDLARGPLIRVMLVGMAPRQHLLLLALHHLIADGWSLGVLMRDLATLYDAARQGRAAALPALPIQYADFAIWQRTWLAGELADRLRAAWAEQLAGAPTTIELPTDFPYPSQPTLGGARALLQLPAPLTNALQALGQRHGATLFMTLLAAIHALLARMGGQNDQLIGAPVAGRTRVETEGLIGCFINTLVLRACLSGGMSFHALLEQVRAVALHAYAHQDLPFEELVQQLVSTRDVRRPPLVQVVFVLQNTPVPELELRDLTLRPLGFDGGTAKFELTFDIAETPDGLAGSIEYQTALFEPATIARLIERFTTLLESIVADPARRLDDLPLLSLAARAELLAAIPTATLAPPTVALTALLAAQAAYTPDAIALVDASQQLSYRALLARAGQLAHLLREHGVGPEVPVALCLERGVGLVIGLLGVLAAGGAYVPLDPEYPPVRQTLILNDSRARLLLTESALLLSLPATSATSLCLDRLGPQLARQPAALPRGPDPAHLAYVIYTSGSTGTPKGVLVSHANVVRLLTVTQACFQFGAADVWTLFHSYAFDFAVWELWGALAWGGRLVVSPGTLVRAPTAFAALVRAQRVSVLNQTPAAFYALLESAALTTPPPGLRLVIFGGEALAVERLAPWLTMEGAVPQLVNMYGITETTVHVTERALSAADLRPARGSPIGTALADLQLYLLDARGHLAPPGVVGEIAVGGAGLARGYLGRPDLTAERFVPNPFGEVSGIGYRVLGAESSDTRYPTPNTRLYKTGDLARYRADGTLEYIGRRDGQIKLRGYRIELGEITATLRRHPQVREAVVLLRSDMGADARLVAYVVPVEGTGGREQGTEVSDRPVDDEGRRTKDEGSTVEDRRLKIEDSASDEATPLSPILYSLSSELRSFLSARLPSYMMPAAIVVLAELPLTAHGKLDTAALPAPGPDRPAQAVAYAPPQRATEQQIAAVWARVLQLGRVGRDDNFFELGGHSLLLIAAHAELEATLQREIGLMTLFEYPTVRSLAEHLDPPQDGGAAEDGADEQAGDTDDTTDTTRRRAAAPRQKAIRKQLRARTSTQGDDDDEP